MSPFLDEEFKLLQTINCFWLPARLLFSIKNYKNISGNFPQERVCSKDSCISIYLIFFPPWTALLWIISISLCKQMLSCRLLKCTEFIPSISGRQCVIIQLHSTTHFKSFWKDWNIIKLEITSIQINCLCLFILT